MSPPASSSAKTRAWLKANPSLDELRERHPGEWAVVESELARVAQAGDLEALKAYVVTLGSGQRLPAGLHDPDPLRADIRRRMAAAGLKQMCLATVAGAKDGRVRFNLLNGWVAQRLLFDGTGLRRKPVPLRAFRLLWPLLWQKRMLMPLVEPRGIFCFYSDALVGRLAERIGDRRCVEIAAGDGTLSRFLRDAGVDCTATDDFSWSKSIAFGDDVRQLDATAALRELKPQVVLCSWPPAGNGFERDVFRTCSVQEYVVIGSRHEFAAGDWGSYRRQRAFALEPDVELARLVLPPEIEPAVWRFTREG